MVDVVVVDDSQFMRIQVRGILEEHGLSVVGEAGNGTDAVETVSEQRPDVVTMDVKMPGMDGIEAVEEIMATQPTPILMLSRYTEDGGETTFEALEAGAVDFFLKPDGEVSPALLQYAADLAENVRVVADAEVSARTADAGTVTHSAGTTATSEIAPESPPTVVVAASTGGPPVVEAILEALPATVGLRVIVVQHMPEQFTDRFAERLDARCELSVHEVAHNDRLGPNEAVVAKGGYHTDVRSDRGQVLSVTLNEEPPVHSVRPAADMTLGAVAATVSGPIVGVVLSGMGRDGTAGLERIREAGGTAIVQQPADARIASMPERAIEAGAADAVRPAAEIPDAILDTIAEGSPSWAED